MSSLERLEANLNEIFAKKAPPLPREGKKALVEYLPWINLVLGLLALYTVYVLWHWAHIANTLINYANNLSPMYGAPAGSMPMLTNRLTFGIWLGLAVLSVEAVLYIAAFPGTRDRKKSGWNLMFYALLVNVVYGVLIVFTSYGGAGNLVTTVVGSAVGLYLLFQIRSSYGHQAAPRKQG